MSRANYTAALGTDRPEGHPLDVLLAPQALAVFGGAEEAGTVGRMVLFNLIRNPFGGVLFPISPNRSSVLGVKAYPNLQALPAPAELAVLATPSAEVPDILDQCLAAGVKAAIVLAPDFRDSAAAEPELERRIRERLRRGPMRVLGLNSFGVVNPINGFNATLAPALAPVGKVGFLSQSGALLTALLNEEQSQRVGCSCAISVGTLLDIDWAEWLGYLAGDPRTECIGIYMEQVEGARAFFAAAREVAPLKPIILVKGGRPAQAEPPGEDVFAEACRCNGVLLVQRLSDLFRMTAHLTGMPAARGRRLAILTNARGPAVLAADAVVADGGRLAVFTPDTVAALDGVLPGRPALPGVIDVGGDIDASRFARAAAIAAHDANVDALLVVLAPQSPLDPVRAAERLRSVASVSGKPVLACWMFGADSPASLAVLRDAGIPTFPGPEAAVRAFGYLWRHTENLRFLAELRQVLLEVEEPVEPARAAGVLAAARRTGRTYLTEAEAADLLGSYGLPGQKYRCAADEDAAVESADEIGYPVLLETAACPGESEGGEVVRLKAADPEGVRRAVRALRTLEREHFELETPARLVVRPLVPASAVEVAVSATANRGLGPMVRLGQPGRPSAVAALAPLTPLTAREMIEKAAVMGALRVCRGGGEPPEFDVLEQFLLRLGRLVAEQPWVKEVAVNSLVVWGRGALVRDVRVTLGEARSDEEKWPEAKGEGQNRGEASASRSPGLLVS